MAVTPSFCQVLYTRFLEFRKGFCRTSVYSDMNKGLKVIWEYIDGENRWIPYSAEVSAQLECAQSKGHTNLFLGDIDCHLAVYSVHLDRSGPIQINSQTGSRRAVRRRFCCLDNVLASGITWLWFDRRRSTWKRFSVYVQEKIEEAFQKGERSLDIEAFSTALPYVIHFGPTDQTDSMQKHKITGKSRLVRRTTGKPYPTTRVAKNLLTDVTEDDDDDVSTPATVEAVTSSAHPGSSLTTIKTGMASKSRSPCVLSKSASVEDVPLELPVPVATLLATPATKGGRKKNSRPKKVPETVASPLLTSKDFFSKYTKPDDPGEQLDDCIICMEALSTPSPYSDTLDVVALVKCQHAFHRSCLQALLSSTTSGQYVQCPLCKLIHGVKLGNQPRGTMTHSVLSQSVPGYEGCGTICIVYNFMPGIQGPEHPKPGDYYQARGFPRHCYLPNNDLGKKVLRLLRVAWDRRLIFTIGQSVTTGQENTITWNEIHHKTELSSNYSGHGYPDPNYFANVMYELASQGVSEEDLS